MQTVPKTDSKTTAVSSLPSNFQKNVSFHPSLIQKENISAVSDSIHSREKDSPTNPYWQKISQNIQKFANPYENQFGNIYRTDVSSDKYYTLSSETNNVSIFPFKMMLQVVLTCNFLL